jgi:hypothetical protein
MVVELHLATADPLLAIPRPALLPPALCREQCELLIQRGSRILHEVRIRVPIRRHYVGVEWRVRRRVAQERQGSGEDATSRCAGA